MRHKLTDLDTALDFAHANRRSNKFCAAMVRAFDVYGDLTPNQIAALLRIRSQRRL